MSGPSFQPRPTRPEVGPVEDEEPPSGGGIFLRLGTVTGSGSAGVASVFEVLVNPFNPLQEAARQEIQRQRRVGKQNPSATDPPQDGAVGAAEGRVAATGRPNTPYSGWIVLDASQE